MTAAVGSKNWVVAYRLTDRLKNKYGDDVQAIHPARYRSLVEAYERQAP